MEETILQDIWDTINSNSFIQECMSLGRQFKYVNSMYKQVVSINENATRMLI